MKKQFNIGDLVVHVNTTNAGYILGKNGLTYKIVWFDNLGKVVLYSRDILGHCIDINHWKHFPIIPGNR